jgi:hypothetical protein
MLCKGFDECKCQFVSTLKLIKRSNFMRSKLTFFMRSKLSFCKVDHEIEIIANYSGDRRGPWGPTGARLG